MDIKPLNNCDVTEQQKNEENTKLRIITPIIQKKWGDIDKIVMEYFTAGRISIDEYNVASRGKPKKVDYLLLYKDNIPLALVEAKGLNHSAEEGFQQAINYAKMLDVPFAYSTNGEDLIEKDMICGLNRTMKIENFPTPDELWKRYKTEKGLTKEQVNIYTQPYYITPDGKRPRYYQRIAINKTIQAVASGKDKILLVLATGTGKTYLAFQIIHRFWKTKTKKKILFLADRNILVDQTMRNDFKPFEDAMIKIDGKNIDTSREVYLSLYQQLKTADKDNYKKLKPDFFDLIIIDECHRGSADTDSNWHEILNYFNSATQIGLTATPKDNTDDSKSNFAYFGEPIYTYSLKQGIEDGFLAPYKVVSVELDIDRDGYYPPIGAKDVDGNLLERRKYTQDDFDRNIIVEDRREIVAKRISDFMKTNDSRYAKTIVFCENIAHAAEMKRLIENENPDLVVEDERYVMQITGDNDEGKAQLDNFIDPGSKYPVIAVTSRLMSTGVDAQTCEIIVLDRKIGSMTEFKQIIGRGTRIKEFYEVNGEKKTKMFFTILDFRKNYLKFADPEFDGDPVTVTTVTQNGKFPKPPIRPAETPQRKVTTARKVVRVNNVAVEIVGENVQYLDEFGNLVEQNISSCIRNNIISQFPTFEDFKDAWIKSTEKQTMANELLLEIDWSNNFKIRYGYNVDNFDIIANFGYEIEPPMSKNQRILSAPLMRFLTICNEDQQELLKLLLNAYAEVCFENLKDLNIFNLPQFSELGWTKVSAVKCFGGKEKYFKILHQLENKLYE